MMLNLQGVQGMHEKTLDALTDLQVAVNVSIKTPIMEVVEKFLNLADVHQFYIVDDDNKLIGILNRKRVFRTLFYHRLQPTTRISELYQLAAAERVEEIFVSHFVSAKPDNTLDDVITMMLENDVYEIPVVDHDGRLIGRLDAIYFLQNWFNSQDANE